MNWKTPLFVPHVLDPRTGAIHVPIDRPRQETASRTSWSCSRRSTRRWWRSSTPARAGSAADDLRGAAPELGVVRHRAGRPRQGRRPRRAAHARRHLRRLHPQAVPRHHLAREHGHVPVRRARLATLPGAQRARPPISTATAISTSSPRRCWSAARRRRGCRRWSGSSRRRRGSSNDTRSRPARRHMRRSTWATWTATASRTSSLGWFAVGKALGSWIDVWRNERK